MLGPEGPSSLLARNEITRKLVNADLRFPHVHQLQQAISLQPTTVADGVIQLEGGIFFPLTTRARIPLIPLGIWLRPLMKPGICPFAPS